jgi:hypothetical protein
MLSNDELIALAKQTALIVTEATAPLLARIAQLEARPQPRDGLDGKDGRDGTDGRRGEDGADGINGRDGAPGIHGKNGADGINGRDGADAVLDIEVVEATLERIVDRSIAKYALDFEIRAGKALQSVVEHLPPPKDGKDGRDGIDGTDGLSMESLSMEYDGTTHEVVLRATVGMRNPIELRYPAGGIRPGGYWREGTKALAGSTWTNGGTMWIARKDTTEEPSITAVDWYIGARGGRDGESAPRKRVSTQSPVKL